MIKFIEKESEGSTGDSIRERYGMSASTFGLYMDKYFLYRGYGYSDAEAKNKSLEYLRSVHLIS